MTRNRPNATLIDKSRLAAVLADFYHIEVDSVIELGTVCGVVSRDGRKYIWKCLRSDARDGFRVAVQRYVTNALCRRGLPAPEPLVNRYGRLVTTIEDQGGYLQPWLSGHPVNPLNRAERLRVSAALGWFHAVSADLSIPAHGQLVRGSLLTKLVLKRNFLLQVWDQVATRCPLLARDEATLFAAANRAIAAAEEPAPYIYAHRDAAPHNFLAQRGGRVALIDFDEAGLDDPLLDLFQFANHGVALGALAPGYFRELVEVYSRNCPLTEQRLQCLWVLFSYPDVLVRTVSEWARRGWADDGLRQVRQAVELERLRRDILKQDSHRLR